MYIVKTKMDLMKKVAKGILPESKRNDKRKTYDSEEEKYSDIINIYKELSEIQRDNILILLKCNIQKTKRNTDLINKIINLSFTCISMWLTIFTLISSTTNDYFLTNKLFATLSSSLQDQLDIFLMVLIVGALYIVIYIVSNTFRKSRLNIIEYLLFICEKYQENKK